MATVIENLKKKRKADAACSAQCWRTLLLKINNCKNEREI